MLVRANICFAKTCIFDTVTWREGKRVRKSQKNLCKFLIVILPSQYVVVESSAVACTAGPGATTEY